MLAENYVSVPKEVDKENEAKTKNKEKDIKTAVDVVTNQIVEKNTSDFKKSNQTLINEIKTATTLQDSYAKLKELYKNNLKKDAERG
ncbi:MAG: hypothetical protein LBC61_02750 [Candidatus Peribacteria bacterium]|jgi:hypothetical protein|nr:hypothetical protein [Candidatus Peribacteria bacterium]